MLVLIDNCECDCVDGVGRLVSCRGVCGGESVGGDGYGFGCGWDGWLSFGDSFFV